MTTFFVNEISQISIDENIVSLIENALIHILLHGGVVLGGLLVLSSFLKPLNEE